MNLKNKSKIILNIFILFCILLLPTITKQYEQKQQLLILESNSLLSSNHIKVNSNINSIWKNKINKEKNIWILGTIENKNNINVMSIYATDFKKIIFPINKGKMFSKNDSKEAIVGSEVDTYVVDKREVFDFNGTKYNVIGKLGASKNSPLQMTALINDSKLLELKEIELSFDGSDINSLSWLKKIESKDKGVERWFDINAISNYIMITVWIILICSIILWIYHFNINSKIMRTILIQIGINRYKILIREIRYLSFIFFMNVIIILGIINTEYILNKILKYYLGLYFITIFLNSIILFYKINKGKFNYGK